MTDFTVQTTQLKKLKLNDEIALVSSINEGFHLLNNKLSNTMLNPEMSMPEYMDIIANIIEAFGGKIQSSNCYIIVNVPESNLTIANENLDIQVMPGYSPQVDFDAFDSTDMIKTISNASDLTFTYSKPGLKLIKISDGLTHTPNFNVHSTIVSQTTTMIRNSLVTVLKAKDGKTYRENSYGVLELDDFVKQNYIVPQVFFMQFDAENPDWSTASVESIKLGQSTVLTSDLQFSYEDAKGERHTVSPESMHSFEDIDRCDMLYTTDSTFPVLHKQPVYENDGCVNFSAGNTSILVKVAATPGMVITQEKDGFDVRSITDIIVESDVQEISRGAFANFTSLSAITFNQKSYLTKIDDYAFQNCTSLLSIEIPDGVVEIGKHAFENCASLKKIIFPSTVKSYDINLPPSAEDIRFRNYQFCMTNDIKNPIQIKYSNEMDKATSLTRFAQILGIKKEDVIISQLLTAAPVQSNNIFDQIGSYVDQADDPYASLPSYKQPIEFVEGDPNSLIVPVEPIVEEGQVNIPAICNKITPSIEKVFGKQPGITHDTIAKIGSIEFPAYVVKYVLLKNYGKSTDAQQFVEKYRIQAEKWLKENTGHKLSVNTKSYKVNVIRPQSIEPLTGYNRFGIFGEDSVVLY